MQQKEKNATVITLVFSLSSRKTICMKKEKKSGCYCKYNVIYLREKQSNPCKNEM